MKFSEYNILHPASPPRSIAETAHRPAPSVTPRAVIDEANRLTILIVDDNSALVAYVDRLLSGRCTVLSAPDGETGLAVARTEKIDLVIVDVVMPGIDGFALLKAIRGDARIHTVPVIMLSADGAEEAMLEAFSAGADDYLVKPFKPRELVARVHTHVRMMRVRNEAVHRENELLRELGRTRKDLESVLEGTSDAFMSLDRDLRLLSLNRAAARMLNIDLLPAGDRRLAEIAPQLAESELEVAVRRSLNERGPVAFEHFFPVTGRWFGLRCYPSEKGVIVFGADITQKKLAEHALQTAHLELEKRVEERTQELRDVHHLVCAVFDRAPGGIALLDVKKSHVRFNAAYQRLTGRDEVALKTDSLADIVYADDRIAMYEALDRLAAGALESFEKEVRYVRPDGNIFWASAFVSMIRGDNGAPSFFVKIVQDISDRKRSEKRVLDSQLELRTLYGRLQQAREEERLTLARDVHDQLGQILSAAKIDIKLLESDVLGRETPLPREVLLRELGSARQSLEMAIDTARSIAMELRSPTLEDHGLAGAIRMHAEEFERRTRIRCHISLDETIPPPQSSVSTATFRIVQEALTNVLRHANAGDVWIGLQKRGAGLLVRITDNGSGILRKDIRSSLSIGLQGMRERATLVRGRLLIGPLRAGGTHVSVRVPLRPDVFDSEA